MDEHFKLGPEYVFGLAEIDSQHKYFVSILNRAYASITNMEEPTVFAEYLKEIKAYATKHFETEEKYFDKYNYSGAADHKFEHQKLKEKVLAFEKDFNQGKINDFFVIVDFLENWLVDHLQIMDQKYVTCFKEHGLN